MRRTCCSSTRGWLNRPWLQSDQLTTACDLRPLEAIYKAVLAHLYIAWIHPFGDGNGRIHVETGSGVVKIRPRGNAAPGGTVGGLFGRQID